MIELQTKVNRRSAYQSPGVRVYLQNQVKKDWGDVSEMEAGPSSTNCTAGQGTHCIESGGICNKTLQNMQ